MAGHIYVNEGTAAASPGTLVDILGDASFTSKQVLIVNEHGTLNITVAAAGLGSTNDLTVGPGEKALVPARCKTLRIIESTGVATFKVIATDSAAPALEVSQELSDASSIADGAVTEVKLQDDNTDNILYAKREFRCLWDFSVDGGAIGTIALPVTLPDNASITVARYRVLTTCTSATDAGTMALGVATDDAAGLVAATAISTGTTWDNTGAWVACTPDGQVGNFTTETTAARTLLATIATEAFTAGKILIVGEYIVSE